jgi:hypothetical protein
MRWLWITAALVAAAFFVYPLALAVPLVDPDEGLHAAIAQEMAEEGDWVIPQFLGQSFLDKPILYTWAQALSLKLFGMTAAAVRLPGLLFGLLGMITTGAVGWRMFGPLIGLVSGILYATMVLPTGLAQCAAHDVALVPCISLSILLFWEADRASRSKTRTVLTLATGVALGLSCLAKGFVGIGLVGAAYGSYLLVTRRVTVGACVRGACALIVAGLVASGWYIAMELRNPGYLYYYFVERHLLGLVTSTQEHSHEPWWYYLPIIAVGGLPWIIYLPAGLMDWWKRRRVPQSGTWSASSDERHKISAVPLLLCWLLACSALLSVAGSKLITYIWPIFPAMAILAGVVWGRVIEGKLCESAHRWFSQNFRMTTVTGPLLVPAGMLMAQISLDLRFSWFAWTLGLTAGLTSWLPFLFWNRGERKLALSTGTVSLAAQFLVAMALIGPPAAQLHSARDLAQHFNGLGKFPPHVVLVEDRVGSLIFYLNRDLRSGLKAEQVEGVRASATPHLREVSPGTVIAIADRRTAEASQYLGLEASNYERAGRFRVYTTAQFLSMQDASPGIADASGREEEVMRHGTTDHLAVSGDSSIAPATGSPSHRTNQQSVPTSDTDLRQASPRPLRTTYR